MIHPFRVIKDGLGPSDDEYELDPEWAPDTNHPDGEDGEDETDEGVKEEEDTAWLAELEKWEVSITSPPGRWFLRRTLREEGAKIALRSGALYVPLFPSPLALRRGEVMRECVLDGVTTII